VTVSPTPILTPISDPNLNLEHLELLHHFVTVTFTTFSTDPPAQDVWRHAVPRMGLSFPFVMHEILAISALHLGYLRPARRDHYYHRATELQNNAMSGFHAIQMGINESNCAAVLIFASLLALQVLADPTRTSGLGFHGYIDHFLHCLRLMQGTRLLVIERWWPVIRDLEELQPWTNVEEVLSPYKIPQEVLQLTNLTQNSSLSESARAAYDQAIDRLHWLYAASEIPNKMYSTVKWVLGWPVQLKDDYLELLSERRPEALILLAYYGTLLHFYCESWAVGDAGTCLVQAINEYLGEYWAVWMRWPNEMILSKPSPR
jgi:Fungal specific transcription factor domain